MKKSTERVVRATKIPVRSTRELEGILEMSKSRLEFIMTLPEGVRHTALAACVYQDMATACLISKEQGGADYCNRVAEALFDSVRVPTVHNEGEPS